MDPNAALDRIRSLSKEIDAEESSRVVALLAEELAITIDGLDDWISHGGSLPSAWAAAR